MDITTYNEAYKLWGLGGVAFAVCVVVVRYVVTWLRQDREKSDARIKEMQDKSAERYEANLQLFLKESAEQRKESAASRKEFSDSLDKVVTRFEGMHQILGDKVEGIGEVVQQLAGKIK